MRQARLAVSAANRACYSGDEVARYQDDPYHRARLDSAVDLLADHLLPGQVRSPLVADLGAGGGATSGLLAARGFRPIACDMMHDAMRAANRIGVATVELDVGDMLPFGSGVLDGILAGEIIEHIYDPALLLAECGRVLRPGGMVVITTPNLATAQDRLRFLRGNAPRQVDPFHEYLHVHIRPFTYELLARGLRRAGLSPGRPLSNQVIWRTRFGELKSTWAAKKWPTLGGTLIVPAIRKN